MTARLLDYIQEVPGTGPFVASDGRFTNTVGTPLVSAVANYSGESIPGNYALVFSSVVAGTSATVKVQSSAANPYNNSTGISVNLDGVTIYKNVVPGIDIVFSSSGSFQNTWTAQVRIGRDLGILPTYGATVGSPGTPERHQVQNTGTLPCSSALAGIRTKAEFIKKVGSIFLTGNPIAPSSTEKDTSGVVSPYAITVANVTGSGPSKVVDVKVDGSTVTVVDNSTTLSITSTGLHCDGRSYTIASGGLTDVTFVLDSAVTNSSTANILIFEDALIQLAADISGAPDSTWGTSDVTLTESGQSAGVITPSGFAYYWVRPLVMTTSNALSNPWIMSPALSASITGVANWKS